MPAEALGEKKEEQQYPKFRIGVHAWMEAQQTSHGVRHDDYKQYQSYCTRRLSRLRHHPAVKKELVHSTKYVSNTKGRPRHAFCARKADQAAYVPNPDTAQDETAHNGTDAIDEEPETVVSHENFLWVLLVSAERSWAHACELQRSNKINRPHILRRLAKAQQFATRLEACAKMNADEVTYKECQAYAGWMKGSWALEKGEFKDASIEFAKAMSLCHELAQEASEVMNDVGDSFRHHEVLAWQDLFATRAETVLRPLFRYCQYELKEAGEDTIEEPIWSSETAPAVASSSEGTISFRGQELHVDNKDLHVLLLKLQSLSTASGTTNQESTFIQSLSTLDDALALVQTSLQNLGKMKAGPSVNAKRHQLDLWSGYLQSKKIYLVMDHTQGLLENVSNHSERVHVYDTLLKHAQGLLQLPGPKSDGNNADGDDEDEFSLQVQATILRIRALKCFHMGMYYYHECGKWAEALALLDHSEGLTKRALEEIGACDEDMPHAEEYLAELQDLQDNKLVGGKICIDAARLADECQDAIGAPPISKPIKTSRPLLQRLDVWDAGDVLADDPPLLMPIPQKPVFYDLAWDYVSDVTGPMDIIQNYIDEQTAETEAASAERQTDNANSGGLFSWLTGK